MRRENCCAGVNAGFTKILAAARKHFAFFQVVAARKPRAVAVMKINVASGKFAGAD
jgi:hypothetical protein